MNRFALWNGLILCAALALGGCKSEGTDGETTTTESAATGETAAAEGGEAAEGAAAAEGGEAAEGAEAAEAAPAGDAPAAAAGDITAQTLVGTWNADFQRSMNENTEMSEEERAMAMAFVGMMQMSLTFADGGNMTMTMNAMGQTESEEGSYSVSGVAGNVVTISATKPAEEGGEPEVETMNLTFESADVFKMAPEGQESEAIYFNRAAQ